MTARAQMTSTTVTARLFHILQAAIPGVGKKGEEVTALADLDGTAARHALQHDLRGGVDEYGD
jgi:hypothetical protein